MMTSISKSTIRHLLQLEEMLTGLPLAEVSQRITPQHQGRRVLLPLANASYTNMLCHMPTLAGVATDVARGTVVAALPSRNRGKSAKLRNLPVINAAHEG
jgi:hypothetical protein